MRRFIRSALEVAATAGPTALARRRNRTKVAILAYHNVVADDEAGIGDTSLHLPLSSFRSQLDRLTRTHDIVALESLWTTVPENSRPRAVITFDDAYRGAVRNALPELARRGLPATVFVAPALLDNRSTWWDEMGAVGLLDSQRRIEALERLRGRGDEVRARWLQGEELPTLPHSYGIASRDELMEFCGTHVAVGGHGWAHECLPALSQPDLRTTLADTLDWVKTWPGRTSAWLALPYGEGTDRVARAALECGYCGVLEIRGGLWSVSEQVAQVPRINVPAGLSDRGLELRTSGLR